jgi:glycosyltransferase involved in cell wall biosynthesis
MTRPTTILYLHSSDELYGSDKSLLDLISGLDRARFRPIVVLPTDLQYKGELTRTMRQQGIEVHHVDMPILRRRYFNAWGGIQTVRRLVKSVPALLSIARSAGVDLVHSNTTAVLLGPLLAAILRVPHVWHVRELILRPRIVKHCLNSYVYSGATVMVCISHAVVKHVESSAWLKFNVARRPAIQKPTEIRELSRIHMIRDAIDVGREVLPDERARVRAELGASPDHVLVGMVGRISSGKGQEYFVEAARQVATTCPNARFAIVGGPPIDEAWRLDGLREQVRALGLDDRLVVTGQRDDVPAVMHALDVFVLPSQIPEGMGRVVVEAMHAAAVPIVTNHGGAPEFVEAGLTGLLVAPEDPSDAARAIVRAVNDEAWRRRASAAARRAAGQFLTHDLVPRMSAIYTSLTQRDRTRQSAAA